MINVKEVNNVLITRTDRLGDVILTLPLVSEAKKIFKNARVYFFVKKYLEGIIGDYESVDELLIEEETESFFEKYKLFKKINPDLVINVKPRFDLALIFFLLRIKYRIGTGYRWYSFLYNYKVYEHRKNSLKHESDYNLNLLGNFINEVSTEKKFFFKYTSEQKKELNNKLEILKLNLTDNFIIVHPGSGGSSKDLPEKTIVEFISLFSEQYPGYKIVLTGLEKEKVLNDRISENATVKERNIVLNLAGKLNLKELMILIDNSNVFISNSTGPIHISGALNKNIIGFYPNEKVMSDTRWKPLGENVKIIKPDTEYR